MGGLKNWESPRTKEAWAAPHLLGGNDERPRGTVGPRSGPTCNHQEPTQNITTKERAARVGRAGRTDTHAAGAAPPHEEPSLSGRNTKIEGREVPQRTTPDRQREDEDGTGRGHFSGAHPGPIRGPSHQLATEAHHLAKARIATAPFQCEAL